MLRHYFIPSDQNDHLPHFLHPKRAWFYSSFFLIMKFIVLVAVVALPLEVFTHEDELRVQEQRVLALTNQLRAEHNVEPLVPHELLHKTAQAKSETILGSQTFAHQIEGQSFSHSMQSYGYDVDAAGENLAIGFLSADSAMRHWMQSERHLANLIDADFQDTGIWFERGEFQGKPVIVASHHFASAAVLATDGDDEAPLVTVNKEQSFVSWEEIDGDVVLHAKAILRGSISEASVQIGNYTIPLTQNKDLSSLFEGKMTIQESPEKFFSIVLIPTVEVLTNSGHTFRESIDWETVEVAPISMADKYLASKWLTNPIIASLFVYSKGIYAFFFFVFATALVTNLLIGKHRFHKHVNIQTAAILIMLLGLYIL